ncbi:MAG TPA: hypothetical protein VHW09_16010 [Bryobacteraceae bacterium]|nr:hypothetical protein [Bryobacteraceae bacterium]
MLNALHQYLPVLVLWCAVCAVASLVVRELGVKCLRKYPLTTLVLVLSLLSFPAAGVFKVTRPYQERVLTLVRREKSVALSQSGCPMFPPDNIWNRKIQDLPLDPNSPAYVSHMGPNNKLHADFGALSGYRYTVTDGRESNNDMTLGSDESDRGPYRIPDSAAVESGSDRHVLVVDQGNCLLYELGGATHTGAGRWSADVGAIFDLRSNKLRPEGWTSADGAGTAIVPGLARYDEVASGHIHHAVRFTSLHTRRAFVWPARHFASSSSDPTLPPMGERFRLKADVDISRFSPSTRVLLTALKEYGMILCDNGGDWYISGALDSRWPGGLPGELASLHGSDFEAVDESGLMVDAGSAQARQ